MDDFTYTAGTPAPPRAAGCPFDPAAELLEAREQGGPIIPYEFPGGRPGWLITGYDLVKSVLADARFSARKDLMRHPTLDYGDVEIPPASPGEFLFMDGAQHRRYRKALMGKFTVRRMRLLTERVEQITADHLDAVEKIGPGVDLVPAFAKPIPATVISELLGVPEGERNTFQEQVDSFLNGEGDEESLILGYAATMEHIGELVAAKRANPTDDVLGDLTSTDLDDEELKGMALLLLAAGLDTTTNMLGLGAFALLQHPEQLAELRDDPSLTDRAVEELLRYLTVAMTFMRTALEDVELGGQTIKAGSPVILSYNTANRDPERFADPHVLDFHRQASGHVAFGYGIHQCLGSQLARVEMRVAFRALLDRFPTLRLAVPAEEVSLRPETADIYGVKSLPVTWDA
ncbi:cytochrome P450 [Saccharopolyspora dendranthemae]|uniref:Cytochrome P450 n=1 Tax=Saccharopolyspora dendranthemae TaxID=1181886 RepID=A0A561U802_9PSEU|nr:cytochrome P450 [Saccharopolyspora dendranthemae]TWF95484.1 cytochrome P450 [Saccharopolyspora dendranthemae]